ncbi:MAG: serine hydroxymethyltransferase, partial [Christensenella sp.]
IAAKAVSFHEALQPEFKEYQKQIVKNAAVLAKTLTESGVRIVSGGTDNHLMLVDVGEKEKTGKEIEALLDTVNITVNKNTIPFEKLSPFVTSGIRIGTPSVTTRGMKEPEMVKIGNLIADMIINGEASSDNVKQGVSELCNEFPLYK